MLQSTSGKKLKPSVRAVCEALASKDPEKSPLKRSREFSPAALPLTSPRSSDSSGVDVLEEETQTEKLKAIQKLYGLRSSGLPSSSAQEETTFVCSSQEVLASQESPVEKAVTGPAKTSEKYVSWADPRKKVLVRVYDCGTPVEAPL